MNEEQRSSYTVALDKKSQDRFEARNFEDETTDVFLVPLLESSDFILSLLDESKPIVIQNSQNKNETFGAKYFGVKFTIQETPQIVFEEFAYPCSLAMAWDGEGSFAIVHTPHFAYVSQGKDRQDHDRYSALKQFTMDNIDVSTSRMVISGTNIIEPLRSEVFNSIGSVLKIPGIELEQFIVESTKANAESKYLSTSDAITGAIFIPKQFTRDGKQKLVFLGVNKADFDATEAISIKETLQVHFDRNHNSSH